MKFGNGKSPNLGMYGSDFLEVRRLSDLFTDRGYPALSDSRAHYMARRQNHAPSSPESCPILRTPHVNGGVCVGGR